MSQETETVTGNPESPQTNNIETDKENVETSQNGEQLVKESPEKYSHQPSVQEDACILKQNTQSEATPKSPIAVATEDFLVNEQGAAYSEEAFKSEPINSVVSSEPEPVEPSVPEPRTPSNSEASEAGAPADADEVLPSESTAPQVVDVAVHSEIVIVEALIDEPVVLNGHTAEDLVEEPVKEQPIISYSEPEPEPVTPVPITNGHSNGECQFVPKMTETEEVASINDNDNNKTHAMNGTIANELVVEDYKLPDVVEVKKNFEYIEPAGHNVALAPPKKGALSTSLDAQSIKQAYQDVRNDGSETQWATFKFEGPTIITSATGADFGQFKSEFGEDERAFGYIRVQTGDEMSRRAKFLLVTWVGPSVSVLKRAKMSTDKAIIKGIISNFAVELQTENISDIDLPNFETVLDKASGAHYGTGVRS